MGKFEFYWFSLRIVSHFCSVWLIFDMKIIAHSNYFLCSSTGFNAYVYGASCGYLGKALHLFEEITEPNFVFGKTVKALLTIRWFHVM